MEASNISLGDILHELKLLRKEVKELKEKKLNLETYKEVDKTISKHDFL